MTDVLWLRTHGTNAQLIDEAFAQADLAEPAAWTEIRDAFDRARGPYSYGLAREVARLGWDVIDLMLDIPRLRDAWIREHGPLPAAATEREALALAAIERFRPRVVVDLNLKVFDGAGLRSLRARYPFIEATVGVATGVKRLERALFHDLVLVPGRAWARELDRLRGRRALPAVVFHHAFNATLARDVQPPGRSGVVVTARVGGHEYRERTEIVHRLLDAGLAEAWLSEAHSARRDEPPRPFASGLLDRFPNAALLRSAARRGRGAGAIQHRLRRSVGLRVPSPGDDRVVPNVPFRERFPDRVHPAIYGQKMFDLLARAEVIVHHEIGASSSLRHFEATGMGAALVTNAFDGIGELFEVGKEILVYESTDELLAIARAAAAGDDALREIGEAGRRRTLKDHNTEVRARQFSDIIRSAGRP